MNERAKRMGIGAVIGFATAIIINVAVVNVANKSVEESMKFINDEYDNLHNRYTSLCNEVTRRGYGHMTFKNRKIIFVFNEKK